MNYYVKRVGQAVFTLFAVVTISFVLIRWLPGGPLDYIRAQLLRQTEGAGSSQAQMRRINQLAKIYTNINPDKPMYIQYYEYMSSTVTGDLGRSLYFKKPVGQIMAESIPWTLFYTSISLIVSFTTGILLGALMAYYEGSRFDFGATAALLWSHAIPYYVAALLLVYVFGYQLGWFPTGGRMSVDVYPGFNWAFVASILNHAALPLASLVLTGLGGGALGMRGNAIQVLGEDYLRVARLRGLPVSRVSTLYVARNAMLPLYTGLLIRIGGLLGGSVILERIFAYPGTGYYLFKAFQARDYTLMMGGFVIITAAIVVGVLIADLTYGLVDPRITTGDESESF